MLRVSRSFPENKSPLFLGTSAWGRPEPCPQILCLLSLDARPCWPCLWPQQNPSSCSSSPCTLFYVLNPTGHRGANPQNVRVPQDRVPNAGNYLRGLYRHTMMIHPNQPSPYTGEAVAQRRGREPSKTHPTLDTVPSPPPQTLLQSSLSPNASDPFDRLKPGGTRRRVLPGPMAGIGSPLSCNPPFPGAPGCREQQWF